MTARTHISPGDLVGSRVVAGVAGNAVRLRCRCGAESTVKHVTVVAYLSRWSPPKQCRACGYDSMGPRPDYRREAKRA